MKYLKIIYSLVGFASLALISSCVDNSREGVPTWESAVHGYIQLATGSESNFSYKGTAPLNFEFKWNSIDGKLSVTKIEFFVLFNEPYIDKDGNPKLAQHGGKEGKLLKTIDTGIPGNREFMNFSVIQNDVYALYQLSEFDYNEDGINTPVFNNPDKPDRVAGGRFVEGDEFKIRWNLTTNDGRVFSLWGPSVCTEFPEANCEFDWVVVCPFDINVFLGAYNCNEPGYAVYPVNFTLKGGNTIVNDNFWDVGASIEYVLDGTTGKVTIPSQSYVFNNTTYLVSGSGTINNCNGKMDVPYVVTNAAGTTTIDANTHFFYH